MSIGRKFTDLKSHRRARYTLVLVSVIIASLAIGATAGVTAGIATFAALATAFLPGPEAMP